MEADDVSNFRMKTRYRHLKKNTREKREEGEQKEREKETQKYPGHFTLTK